MIGKSIRKEDYKRNDGVSIILVIHMELLLHSRNCKKLSSRTRQKRSLGPLATLEEDNQVKEMLAA